tara:strand:+ start:188 stop:490 length:303 start_codon:yes stop_codon:yes gene_type:complete
LEPPRANGWTKEIGSVSQEVNVLALVKGKERYIFLFDDKRRPETLRALGRFASNTELSFSWYDAAVLSQKVRQPGPQTESKKPRFDLPLSTDNSEQDEAA